MAFPENKIPDTYEFVTRDEDLLVAEINEMEQNSEWFPGIISSALELEAIEGPIFGAQAARKYHLDATVCDDTSDGGTQLLLHAGKVHCVRDTAKTSICDTAKLYGSALGRMSPNLFADTINNGLSVARGSSLILERYGKVSAVHSDAIYSVMPISTLLAITQKTIRNKFGSVDFINGYNSHSYTQATWSVPSLQSKLVTLFQKATANAPANLAPVNLMPVIRFASSDTAASAAHLTPMFSYRGALFRLGEGVSVKHEKRANAKYGIDKYVEDVDSIYDLFAATAEKIKELSDIDVFHPENCIISLCKKYGIPKKYGEVAREEMEMLTLGGNSAVTAYDVYLCMTQALAAAEQNKAKISMMTTLEESVYKVLRADWAEHDVGGTVAW